jgi:hypothetical protein
MIDREPLRKDIQPKLRQFDLNGVMDIYMTPEVGVDGWPQIHITFPLSTFPREDFSCFSQQKSLEMLLS